MDNLKDLHKLFAAIDNAFAEVQRQYGEEVRCGKGCDDCCHAVFDMSLIEAANLLHVFRSLESNEQKRVLHAATKAHDLWEEISSGKADPSVARIGCPLLTDKSVCGCYEARPINCRTYGIPTVIGGAGHVCGFSGFEQGKQYPTVNLEQLQQILYDFSVRLAGEEAGRKRWPVAEVLMRQDEFADFL